MSQTILTIPLNSPGGVAGMGVGGQPTATSSSSPSSSSSSNLYPPSISPQIPNNNHHHHHHGSSSHHQSHLQQHQAAAAAHAHGATRGHPLSPPVAPTVPPATSPDFSDHHPSALPAPNLNLGPHSLSSQMGAHIPRVTFVLLFWPHFCIHFLWKCSKNHCISVKFPRRFRTN